MNSLIGFMIENSIVNSFPIFLASLVSAYISGPFLKNVGANSYIRIVIYSIIGVVAGLWSYSTFDIPDRGIEALEAITLGTAMFVYALVIISPIVLFKNRRKHSQSLKKETPQSDSS